MTRIASPAAVLFERLHDDTMIPTRATEGSAGYDLRAYLRDRSVKCSDGFRTWEIACEPVGASARFSIPAGAMALVPLGFKARLPEGYEAQIRPRSGTTFKKGLQIPNAPGTIDSDFPDEWMVLMRNPLAEPVLIEHGERIAQMVFHRFATLEFETGAVGLSTSRAGGFGSTGR